MGDFTEARNQKPQEPKEPKEPKEPNETAFEQDMFVQSRQVGSFHPVPCRRARLCNDASSVGPLTMAGTIFLQIVALVVSFFMAVQYFLRYAPRRLFGLFPPWCLLAMKLDENRHAHATTCRRLLLGVDSDDQERNELSTGFAAWLPWGQLR